MSRFLRALAATFVLAACLPACDGEEGTTAEEQDATASSGRFELFVGEDGKHRFQLLAKNGERLLVSQAYGSKSSAKGGITSVKKNGRDGARYQVLEAQNGEFYWNLLATNGQVIGTSETYASKSNADRAVTAAVAALASPASADAEASGPHFETFKGADGKTYFRLRAANGQIVLSSQAYSSKSAAEGGIASVKKVGIDAASFQIVGGEGGQHFFRLVAANGKIVGRGEMYATKSNALRAADSIRDLLRDLTAVGDPTLAEFRSEVERVSTGLTYMSESDYPFAFVSGEAGAAPEITEAMVREVFADVVDADPDADRPMAELFAMEGSWEEWKDAEHSCQDPEDPVGLEQCTKMRSLEQVLEANLEGTKVFYFGANGEPGSVDGVGVSVFIVGFTADGILAGVRTLAIWT